MNVDIPLVKVRMPPPDALMPALERVLYSGYVGEGDQVKEFEAAFEQWRGGKGTAVACSSGTAALHLALVLAGIGPGDHVISTALTAEPTNTAILQTGASIVWADVSPDTGLISTATVAPMISSATKAIVAVDYAGYPVAMAPLRDLADRHGLTLIDDAAHGLGARYRDCPIGDFAHYTIHSFQAVKHMTTGDGGMLIVSGTNQVERAKRLRWFGLTRGTSRDTVDIAEAGFKYTMNNISAAIGLAQLATLEADLARHRINGQAYTQAFENVPGLQPASVSEDADPSYWLFTLLVDDAPDLIAKLTEHGIAAARVHRRNDAHSVFAPYRRPLPSLDHFWNRLVHLPCGWWVSDEDRERVITLVREG
jgi:dTDP-4-amino-4,6-dideoxygalactose transaminase